MTTCGLVAGLLAVLLTCTGAEEVLVSQLGRSITLPLVRTPNTYMYWSHGNVENILARHNPFDGWALMGVQWKDRLSLSGDNLIIKDLHAEDFGIFLFSKLENQKKKVLKTLRLLRVNVSVTSPHPLLPGETLSLLCQVEAPQDFPVLGIHFLDPHGRRVDTNTGAGLVKMDATAAHNGTWMCVVSSSGQESKVSFPVHVFKLVSFPSGPRFLSESSPLGIPCSLPTTVSWEQVRAKGLQEAFWLFTPLASAGGAPQKLFSLILEKSLRWSPAETRGLTPDRNLQKGSLSLSRRAVRLEERGNYTCTLVFKGGVTVKTNVPVDVLQIVSSAGRRVVSGNQLVLTCGLGRVLTPDLLLRWLPPKGSQQRPVTSGDELRLPAVSVSDGGEWRCELRRNGTLLTTARISLSIEPAWSTWRLATVSGAAGVFLLLLVLLPVILLRRRQRRLRRPPRHRLCNCKKPKPKGFYKT